LTLNNIVAISDCHNGDWKSPLRYWLMDSGNAIVIYVDRETQKPDCNIFIYYLSED